MKGPEAKLAKAQYDVEQAKKRLSSTVGALQERLEPSKLVNEAWEGVRDKSNEVADGALQVVKERPIAASGAVAGMLMFLARKPLWRGVSRLFSRREDEGVVRANIDNHDTNYDLTAPAVKRSHTEGANA